jgi:hypothetical protein
MANTRKIPLDIDLAERAKFFGVCERTVRRWHNASVNLFDPCEVAMHLAGQKTPAPAAVQAVKNILKTELNNLNS